MIRRSIFRRSRRARRSPSSNRRLGGFSVESLEPRRLMTARAVVDFDDWYVSAERMEQGGWEDHGAEYFSQFKSLFNSVAPDFLDFNGDDQVDSDDYEIAVDRIMAKVHLDYAPYQLRIKVSDEYANRGLLTDDDAGDVIAIVTGGMNNVTSQSAYGVSPWSDLGNEHDEIVWVFGRAILNASDSAAEFVNRVSRTISHEMGHAFGLGHVDETPVGLADARYHHVMNCFGRDWGHDFVFQDIEYETDVFDYKYQLSEKHPELNGSAQNAHAYLSHPDVLGISAGNWIAALKPGELTVSGSDDKNDIYVFPQDANSWLIRNTSFTQLVYSQGTVTIPVTTHWGVDFVAPGMDSLNPYSEPLSIIRMLGNGGDDVIFLDARVDAVLHADGGSGNDVIVGGQHDDVLHGGSGSDRLYGNDGDDHLYGDDGADTLYGDGGDDYLDGGSRDNFVDHLWGGAGADQFVVRRYPWSLSKYLYGYDDIIEDRESQDRCYYVYI